MGRKNDNVAVMERYRSDPVFRAKRRAFSKKRYQENEGHKAKVLARSCEVGLASRRDVKLWSARQIVALRHRCRKEGILFALDATDIPVPNVCPVLGVKIAISSKEDRWAWPSVDRLRPELGYVKGNVRVISNRANTLKNNATLDELRAVVAYMERELEPERVLHSEGIC